MKIAYKVLSNFSPNSMISILLHIGTLHKNQLLAFTFLFINIDPNGQWYIINMLGLVNHIAPNFFLRLLRIRLMHPRINYQELLCLTFHSPPFIPSIAVLLLEIVKRASCRSRHNQNSSMESQQSISLLRNHNITQAKQNHIILQLHYRAKNKHPTTWTHQLPDFLSPFSFGCKVRFLIHQVFIPNTTHPPPLHPTIYLSISKTFLTRPQPSHLPKIISS